MTDCNICYLSMQNCHNMSIACEDEEYYTIHSEGGSFKLIQEETLIGLGYAIDELKTEGEEYEITE